MASQGDADLLVRMEQAAQLYRLADSIALPIAGEIEHRSNRFRDDPLAKRFGERSAANLIAVRTQMPIGAASTLTKVGLAVRPRTSLTGEPLPSLYPALSAAAHAGTIPLDSAREALDCLTRASRTSGTDEVAELEALLVEKAIEFTISEFKVAATRTKEHVDPDGVAPREKELEETAYIRFFPRRNGHYGIEGDADPLTMGWLKTAVNAVLAPRRAKEGAERTQDEDDLLDFHLDGDDDANASGTPECTDPRPYGRRFLDALVTVARRSIQADEGEIGGTDVTLNVTVTLDELRSGVGAATIDGIDQPISAKTARRLAATANIIPIVLGGKSEPLDVGRSRRLFTKAQRIALARKYKGCAIEGCTIPAHLCQAAHIKPWWMGGRTDMENALLLCPMHHEWLDRGEWSRVVLGLREFIVPSANVDPLQRPRPIRRRESLLA